jgi:hypothetical protein
MMAGPSFAVPAKLGLEGIVSKRKDSAYRFGRSPDWLKMKSANARPWSRRPRRNGPLRDTGANGGLHMNNGPKIYLSQEVPQWMKDMFEELSGMFEELFSDADRLNLKEMQRRLDEQQAHFEKSSQ